MRENYKYIVLFVIIIISCAVIGCTKPYAPPAIKNPGNYLVVEGTINTGNDSTVIILSRTVSLNSAFGSKPELNATVAIQNDQNQSYPLKSIGNGVYTSSVLSLDASRKYRLSIATSDGNTYVSDYAAAKVSPPIDSVGFDLINSNTPTGEGVQIYVNTHDPNNNTHYYRWDYTETWQFHAKYFSSYISNGVNDVALRLSQYIYQCWSNDLSTSINLGSSAKLSQDVINKSPITFVASTSEKIETRYSILVKQYALTADAYNYFNLLKQNTEELGSIFDAQPSELTGNIHCITNPSLPAIGYITAGTIQQKRVYIDNTQLPHAWIPIYPFECQVDTALYVNPHTKQNDVLLYLVSQATGNEPIAGIFSNGPNPIGYTYSDRECTDCSIRGTLIKPSFWQ